MTATTLAGILFGIYFCFFGNVLHKYNKIFFSNFKDRHCYYKEHLEERQKERRSNRNKKQLVLKNRKTVYHRNTYRMLDECELLDEEHTWRETQTKRKKRFQLETRGALWKEQYTK